MMRRRKKKYFFHQTWKGIKLKADGCKLQTVSLHFTARDWHFTPLVHCIHSNYLCCKLISRCELTGVVPPLGFTGMYIKSPRRNNNTSPTTNDNTVNTAAKSYWPLGLLSQGYPWDPWHLDRSKFLESRAHWLSHHSSPVCAFGHTGLVICVTPSWVMCKPVKLVFLSTLSCLPCLSVYCCDRSMATDLVGA